MKNSFKHTSAILDGMKDGIPIALGYLAVGFSIGIACKNAGLNAFQGFLVSLLNNASAGEYAGLTVIGANGSYWEVIIMTLVANARYLLMSCALSQRFAADTPLHHRLLIGYDVTDEIFGITIARTGNIDPFYTYGAMFLAIPAWAVGGALGVIIGNLLPASLISAFSVALFGMFISIIITPSRQNRVLVGCVAVSFALSFAAAKLPLIREVSSGTRTIILTVAISALAAILFPTNKYREDGSHDA